MSQEQAFMASPLANRSIDIYNRYRAGQKKFSIAYALNLPFIGYRKVINKAIDEVEGNQNLKLCALAVRSTPDKVVQALTLACLSQHQITGYSEFLQLCHLDTCVLIDVVEEWSRYDEVQECIFRMIREV